MLWLAMTPDTRGASALSATGNHNLTCLLSGTYLFEARPWILHSIRHKGLLLFQINLPIRIRDLCHLFPSLPFLGFSLLSFFHNLQKNYRQHTNNQHESYCGSGWGIGIRVRLNPPPAQRRAERYSNESTNISMAFPSTWVHVLFCGPAYQSSSTIVD